MTLMVKGTWASELRTRFCPTRFTYSVTTGSSIILELRSTSWAIPFPRAISFSMEKKFTPLPTLRLPMASTSSLEFLGCTDLAGVESAGCELPLEAGAPALGSGGGGGGVVWPMGMGRETWVLSGFCVWPCWVCPDLFGSWDWPEGACD